MRQLKSYAAVLILAACLAAAGCARKPIEGTMQPAGLKAYLWMQTSAEYEALCRQVYRTATREVLADVQSHQDAAKPPAVVLDLDETVLNNAAFMNWRMRNGEVYTPESWTQWMNERWDTIGLVPGAADFLHAMTAAGVRVVYLSNRFEADRPGTILSLKNLGVGFDDMERQEDLRLLLMKPGKGNNSKTPRRQMVEDKYRVVAYFGDNMHDFDENFSKVPDAQARRQLAIDHQDQLGTTWFVLPNPSYGTWERYVNREDPMSSLRP